MYCDDFVLLAKSETVQQSMIGRLVNVHTGYGMERNVDRTKFMRFPRKPSLPETKVNFRVWNISTV
jgi:hypothetical protein